MTTYAKCSSCSSIAIKFRQVTRHFGSWPEQSGGVNGSFVYQTGWPLARKKRVGGSVKLLLGTNKKPYLGLTMANSGTSLNKCYSFRRQTTSDSTPRRFDRPSLTQFGGADTQNGILRTERCRRTCGASQSRPKVPGQGAGPISALSQRNSRTECFH